MLERDEAHRLHSNSTREVVQLKAGVEGLQVALSVMEEEVVEAQGSATVARVRASGVFSTITNSCCQVFVLGF